MTGQEAREIVDGYNEEWEEVPGTKVITGHDRWSIFETAVFHHIPSNKYYRFDWSFGATEMQDESPFEYDDTYTASEVHLVKKICKVWENVL